MVAATVPEAQLALSQQPQTQIDASVFNRPSLVSIGSGLEQLGSGLEADADSAAKQQAQSDVKNTAVTLAADGTPQIATSANSIILGQAGQDYQASFAAGMSARLASNVSDTLTQFHLANETNPQGFKAASDAYTNSLRNTPGLNPQISNRLADMAANEGSQRLANISEKVFELDTKENLQAVTTNIADTQNKMAIIAKNGGMGTPAYQQLDGQLKAYYGSLTSTKLFGYSQERADSELATAESGFKGEAIVGAVEAAFKRTGGDGGRAGAQKMLDQKLDDPALHLSIQERDQFKRQGMAHLEYLTSDQKVHIDASRLSTDKIYKDIVENKIDVPPALINQALAQAQTVGDSESILKISQAAAHYPDMRAMRGLTNEQRVQAAGGALAASSIGPMDTGGGGGSEKQALDYFTSKGWTPAQASGIVGNLVRESGLRSGAVNKGDGSDGSDSIGIGQWNGTRAADLKTFAAAQGKPASDFGTQLAFVQHELEGSEGNAAALLRKAGTAQEAASAFALGYERPQGYLSGDINQVAGGKDRVAAAMRLAGGGASSAIVPTGALSSSLTRAGSSLPYPTQAEMAANPFALSVWSDMANANAERDVKAGKAVGEALATQLASGNVPNPQTVAGFQQLSARYAPELGDVAQKVNANWDANVLGGKALATMTPAAAQAYADQVRQLAQGADIPTQMRSQALQDFIKKGAENLKADQFGESVRRTWIAQAPQPIDLAQPNTWSSVMAQHAMATMAIGGHTQNEAISMLAENEQPALKSVMTSGTLDQRQALLAAIVKSGATEPVLKATLGALAGSKETLPLAVAGSVSRDNPQAARDILQGQQLMQAEPKLAPNKDDFPGEFAKVLPFNDFPQTEVRQGMDGAVQAMYAKMSADAGDTTGVINADRVDKAVTAVTGGVFNYRGAKAVTPWYGATQADSDAAIRTLSDADFATARTSDGSKFPANALKPSFSGAFTWNNWRLQSYGDGKYLVFSGADTARQYLNDAGGGRFVLDLGAKRDQARRAGMGLAQSVNTPLAESSYYGGGN